MKLIFAGTPQNAAHTLLALLESGREVVGVITRPDAPTGRKQILTPSPVAVLAESRALPIIKTKRISADEAQVLKAWNADLGIVVAFGSIFNKEILDIPTNGWINIHYSLLPKWPGAAPVQNAILAGDEETGVTVFCLDEGIDTGNILVQSETSIHRNETSGQLLERLTELGSSALLDVLVNFDTKTMNAHPQRRVIDNRNARKPTRELAKIDWKLKATEIHNLVRAMNPEPMAWCLIGENPIRVISTALQELLEPIGVSHSPGSVFVLEKRVFVKCGSSDVIELIEVQPAGKNPMKAFDWFNGLTEKDVVLS